MALKKREFTPESGSVDTYGITSDRKKDKWIRRRYQSLHESIDSVPGDSSFHHNWQVGLYIGAQNERNNVFSTSMDHLDKTLPSAYN